MFPLKTPCAYVALYTYEKYGMCDCVMFFTIYKKRKDTTTSESCAKRNKEYTSWSPLIFTRCTRPEQAFMPLRSSAVNVFNNLCIRQSHYQQKLTSNRHTTRFNNPVCAVYRGYRKRRSAPRYGSMLHIKVVYVLTVRLHVGLMQRTM